MEINYNYSIVDDVVKVKAATNTSAHASYLDRTEAAQRACLMPGLQVPERSSAAVKKTRLPPLLLLLSLLLLLFYSFLVPLYRLFRKNSPENAVAKQLLTRLAD